ncbi:MAG: VTC domain-containing protein, partial [Verrucomicrobiota bacterium]
MEAHQKRKEYKFVLASGVAELIRTEVARNLPPDRDARDGYPIISEYYDSEARCSYWQKQFGSQNRRRVRTRVYGRANAPIPPSAFVEVKHKLNGQASKRRVPVDMEAIVNFSTGRLPGKESIPEVMDRRVLSEIEGLLREQNGRPVVQIRYHRYAFDSGPEGTIRITFDI